MKLLKTLAMATIISMALIACGSGSGGGDGGGDNGGGTSPLVGTWDLAESNDGNQIFTVPSGLFTFAFTESTFHYKTPFCDESGTYTTDGSTIILTTTQSQDLTSDKSGTCHVIDFIGQLQYTVTATAFTMFEGVMSSIWNKL